MSVPFAKQESMAFPQFAAAAAAAAAAGLPASVPQTSASLPPSSQMSAGSPPAPPTPRGCCENGRPVLTDPHTGQTVCSCQYSPTLLAYPRVPPGLESVYSASAYAAAVSQGYMALGAEGSAFYSPLGTSPYDLKDSAEAWRTLAAQPAFPYDPMSLYPYGAGRKNATRENTNTLKAWLYEHRKNPYPTKGEKIMLAIITKMTLTQVSTWFANARRRLKKENKMTWSPRNRSEDGSEAGDAADLADVDGDGNGGDGNGGNGVGNGGNGNVDDDGEPLSPGREIDVMHGMTSSSRPSSPLSPSGHEEGEGKEGIINVDEDSCSSFKDHLNHNHRPHHPHHHPDHHPLGQHHLHHHHHHHHLVSDDIRKSLLRDRSPLRDGVGEGGRGGGERREREMPSSSPCHSEDEEEKRDKDHESSSPQDVVTNGGNSSSFSSSKVAVSNGHPGSPSPTRDSRGELSPNPSTNGTLPITTTTTTTTSSSSTSSTSSTPPAPRPKIWSVTEFLHPPSSSSSSTSSISSSFSSASSITSSALSSSQAAMMTAAARAAMLAQAAAAAANGGGGVGVGVGVDGRPAPSGPFPAGIRPAPGGLSSGFLYLPPGASASAAAAWAAAANARFGHLAGAYPLSLSHSTLSYPYSFSSHHAPPGSKAASLEGSAAAMRGLSMEALREAHLGAAAAAMGKLPHPPSHPHPPPSAAVSVVGAAGGRPNGSLFSPARELDHHHHPGIPRGPPSAISSGRLVESNI